jgi:SH3-like domain-containing protein
MTKALSATLLAAVMAQPVAAESQRPRARPAPMPVSAQTNAGPSGAALVEAAAEPKQVALPAMQPQPSPAAQQDPNRGSVTNLPLPRYVSLKTGEGNARRGPGLSHRIDWVFTRAGMPLRITAEYEHWRRVEDAEGLGGWVHYSLLSGVRTAIVAGETAEFHSYASADASVLFKAEAGVVAKIIECANDWCRVSIEGEKGWAPISALWGVDPGEVIE